MKADETNDGETQIPDLEVERPRSTGPEPGEKEIG
jgi:hypothetical protein